MLDASHTDTPTDTQAADQLARLLEREQPERVLVVTGAGISAESGIPTFRGADGYWTVGSVEYQPEEMATLAMFNKVPRELWRWYLYRKGVCNAAKPNPAHFALAELERTLGDRFTLITQNVDGLHLIAGNSMARTLEVHGNTDHMRAIEGDRTPLPIPTGLPRLAREDPLTDEIWEQLVTPDGRRTRPHILWFDERYEEELYRSDTAIAAAKRCDLIVVIGTSGAAAIPYHAAAEALNHDAAIITIDPEHDNPFASHARNRQRKDKGVWLPGSSSRWVPELVRALTR